MSESSTSAGAPRERATPEPRANTTGGPDASAAAQRELASILIVDDEPRNLSVLEAILDRPDYRLVRAESPEQALFALLAQEFALLILDVRMPGMTGFELAHAIRRSERHARVPIIFLTAHYGADQHVLEGYNSGAIDYLLKPVDPAILRSKVASLVELHHVNRDCAIANRALLAEVVVRRRAEERLRALTHRVVQVQEAERRRVAVELHDNISQMLCTLLIRGQGLTDGLVARRDPAADEARELLKLLKQAAGEVEHISQTLRPSVLDQLGLVAVLRDTSTEFEQRTGVVVVLECCELVERVAPDVELAIYRILQEALRNVEQHARARRVELRLSMDGAFLRLAVRDDGVGFEPEQQPASEAARAGLGLLSMHERAIDASGTLSVHSKRDAGTEVEARIPLSPPRSTRLETSVAGS